MYTRTDFISNPKWFIVVFALVFTIVGCFCGVEHRDVLTRRPEYWGGFPPGREYELLQDVFCLDGELNAYYRYQVSDSGRNSSPNQWLLSVQQYRNAGIADCKVTIVETATLIRVTEIEGYRNIGLSLTTIYGQILNGPLTGRKIKFGDLAMADQFLPASVKYARLRPRPEYLRPLPLER